MEYSIFYIDYIYVLIVAGVMLLSGYCSAYNLLGTVYNFLSKFITNKKWLLIILSAVGGSLPIQGRVIATAGMFDTLMGKQTHSLLRPKFGILNYIATHHYYMWSPLEKTVLIPMAVLNLSYLQLLGFTWPLLLICILALLSYIAFGLKDINSYELDISKIKSPKPSKIPNPFSFIKWKTLIFVYSAIVLGNFAKLYSSQLLNWIDLYKGSFFLISITAFCVAWILGSSGKFAGIVAALCGIFGIQYLTYFMAIEFSAYLLSPTHKCNAISCSYFDTPVKYYFTIVSIWSLFIILTGVVTIL